MTLRPMLTSTRRRLRNSRVLQLVLVAALWQLGNAVARATGWPIPGAILGMLALLALLASGRVHDGALRKGANWLVGEMLLFFVPAVLAVLDHPELLGWLGVKIALLIVLSTVVVMSTTALVVELGLRLAASPEDAHGTH